uniref:Uncharacterized protein n=1 Tax=Acrobeloides nanus TaxID=290746 RepID=A0A914DCW9_9BILA
MTVTERLALYSIFDYIHLESNIRNTCSIPKYPTARIYGDEQYYFVNYANIAGNAIGGRAHTICLLYIVIGIVLSAAYQGTTYIKHPDPDSRLDLVGYIGEEDQFDKWLEDYIPNDDLYLDSYVENALKLIQNYVDGIIVMLLFLSSLFLLWKLRKIKQMEKAMKKVTIAILLQNIVSVIISSAVLYNLILYSIKSMYTWMVEIKWGDMSSGYGIVQVGTVYDEAIDTFLQIGMLIDSLIVLLVFTEYRLAIVLAVRYFANKILDMTKTFVLNSTSVVTPIQPAVQVSIQ